MSVSSNVSIPPENSRQIQSKHAYDCLPVVDGQTRVIVLKPDQHMDAPLVVELQRISLDRCPIYEALSYVWGLEKSTQRLLVQVRDPYTVGTSTSGIVSFSLTVTKNLEIALRYLRYKSAPRCLWVDAICINQADVAERNVQVKQMGRVYSSASQVLIWLGEAADDSSLVFELIDNFDHESVGRPEDWTSTVCDAVEKLFARQWWLRRWVVQELVLASQEPLVMCGERSIQFGSLISFLISFGFVVDWGLAVEFRLEKRIQLKARARQRIDRFSYDDMAWVARDLFDLFQPDCEQHATDPRDHIYALLSLTTDWYRDYIKVDYSLSTIEVYQQATVAMILQRQNLDVLLSLSKSGICTISNLPSWTRDFSQTLLKGNVNRTPSSVRETNVNDPQVLRVMRQKDIVYHSETSTLSIVGSKIGIIVKTRPSKTKPRDLLNRKQINYLSEALDTFWSRLGITQSELEELLLLHHQSQNNQPTTSTTYPWLENRQWPTHRALTHLLTANDMNQGSTNTPFDLDLVTQILFDSHRSTTATATTHENRSARDRMSKLMKAQQEMLLGYLKRVLRWANAETSYFSCTTADERRRQRQRSGHGNSTGGSGSVDSSHFLGASKPQYLDIAGRDVREGDVIAVLCGARYPAVLRLKPAGTTESSRAGDGNGDEWMFVGFAKLLSEQRFTADSVLGDGSGNSDSRAEDVIFDLV